MKTIQRQDSLNKWKNLKVGDPVWINGEKRPYRVRSRNDRYIICTKPYNPKRTVMYFVVDLDLEIRGPDNLVFCMGYETQEQCDSMLDMLSSGKAEVSRRRCVKI